MLQSRGSTRVVTNLSHGEHAIIGEAVEAAADQKRVSEAASTPPTTTRFDYMFKALRDFYPGAHLDASPASTVVLALKALGSAMVEQGAPADGNSTVAPIYTYWGQFVDHDLTANTDRNTSVSIVDAPLEPMQPEKVRQDLVNLRQPQLNLDSVYGNGPGATGPDEVPYDGDAFEIGTPQELNPAVNLPGGDLPRDTTADSVDGRRRPLIGDGRNDENLVIAQLHVSFLRFHNNTLTWLQNHPEAALPGVCAFDRAKQLTQWHYQWVTVHDFLRTIAKPEVVDGLLDGTIAPVFTPPTDDPFMPLEFSIAAFRFGHSMVRGRYDWNKNFGTPADPPFSTFEQLFQFTGGGKFIGPLEKLPANWPAQFERLTGAEPTPGDAPAGTPPRLARKIDTHLAGPLNDLRNEGSDADSVWVLRILKRLAVRNLLRGYRLALPTGQAVAGALGIAPLTVAQILKTEPTAAAGVFGADSPVNDALIDGGFVTATPLWFYILREAEVLEDGNRLGPVGSRIVAETIIGQIRSDPDAFLPKGWNPSQGVTLTDGAQVDTIINFLRFADMHPHPQP
ncbi:MAG TPA: heme peroxidase family protein [Microlunatus sp.]|jgi:hypothetical protein|nr:heme peroxidase family protein [Microlunatus sp.]